jgi:outer membrane protein assembly factor BamB
MAMSVSLTDRQRRTQLWASVAARTATVAGVFVLVVLGIMAWVFASRLVKDPLDSEHYRTLKVRLADLRKQPSSESLTRELDEVLEQIRAEDLRLRQEYFRQRRLASHGAWLLLGGMAVFLAAAKTAATLRRTLPTPDTQVVRHDLETQPVRAGRWAVSGLGVLLAGAMMALAVGIKPELPATGPPVVASPNGNVPSDLPTREALLKNWPAFRGFTGSGISPYDNIPTRWDVKTGEGIVWKSPIPLSGNSSPVVWNGQLFLTGATPNKRQVFCYDTASGKLLWQQDVPGIAAGDLKVNKETGYASPTPATDGRRLYVSYATGDLAALDFTGHLVWQRSLGLPVKNPYGHATSLRVWRNLLLVQFDQGAAREGLSRLLALDTTTGHTAWEVKRGVPSSWSSPILIEVDGQDQLITCGDPWVIAYSPADGKELWRADCLRQDVGPSPVFAEGVVYTTVEYRATTAIRTGGQGDVTKTHVLWENEDGAPDTCSPLVAGPYVFLLTTYGARLTCLDRKSGKAMWELEVEGQFSASPCLAGKYVYLFGMDDKGKAVVIEPGPAAGKVVSTTEMGAKVMASPAFQDGRLYVRTETELFCIGKK